MLASKITSLAILRVGRVTGVVLADVLRVEMTHSGGAVAISWDRLVVDVVYQGTVGGNVWKVGEVDLEGDASLALSGAAGDGAGDGGAGQAVVGNGRELCGVGCGREVGLSLRWTELAGVGGVDGGLGDDGTLVGEDTAGPSGRENRENARLGGCQRLGWWRWDIVLGGGEGGAAEEEGGGGGMHSAMKEVERFE